jgi:hypothetical protein
MRISIGAGLAGLCLVAGWLPAAGAGAAVQAQSGSAASNCTPIATPRPSAVYTYQHIESTGGRTQSTQQWENVTATGSRVRTTGPAGVQTQVNVHHIVDDVAVLDRSTKLNGNGGVIDATTFSPGIPSDPAFRACAGRSWPIPSVTATFESAAGNRASARTPAGKLAIVAIHEKVTVPAGTFDTVHYTRTSQSSDEYWKSIDQGVVVKHLATGRGGTVTESLVSMK